MDGSTRKKNQGKLKGLRVKEARDTKSEKLKAVTSIRLCQCATYNADEILSAPTQTSTPPSTPPPLNPPFIRLLLICINLLSISGSHHDKQRKGNVFLEILGSAAGVGGKTKVSIKQTILSCTPADSLDLKSDM